MVSIVADNQEIERSLETMIALAKSCGAEFSDTVVVSCRGGEMKIEAPPETAGQVLARLPWDALVPLPPFRLSVVGDDIVVLSCEDGLTPTSIALLEAMLELYNLAGKIAEHRQVSSCLLIAAHPALLECVAQRYGHTDPLIALLRSGGENMMLQTFFKYQSL